MLVVSSLATDGCPAIYATFPSLSRTENDFTDDSLSQHVAFSSLLRPRGEILCRPLINVPSSSSSLSAFAPVHATCLRSFHHKLRNYTCACQHKHKYVVLLLSSSGMRARAGVETGCQQRLESPPEYHPLSTAVRTSHSSHA